MLDFFSDDARRNPYPLYDRARRTSPLVHVPPPFDGWLIFDYAGVRHALSDHATFSSAVPAPRWFLFFDPPLHTKLRGLISRAFTPRVIANLEPTSSPASASSRACSSTSRCAPAAPSSTSPSSTPSRSP